MKKALLLAGVILSIGISGAHTNEYAEDLNKLAREKIKTFAHAPEVIAAIKSQNVRTSNYNEAKISDLDSQWRTETEQSNQPMISAMLAKPVSQMLFDVQEQSDGLFTEIFVMDAKGLNVAQSEVTSDYWQGDEAKWQKTFLSGPEAVHLSELEEDESTQTFQSQVSMSIADPETGAVIGAITVGVDVGLVE